MPNLSSSSPDPLARLAEQQYWITPDAEQRAQDAIRSVFTALGRNGDALHSALRGDWLHQPLHAVLTDLPVGSWTATVLLDLIAALTGAEALDAGADISLKLGLIGAVAAAVTGLTDWKDIEAPRPRKVGAVHALLNIASTTLFATSCFMRTSRKQRSSARVVAAAGYAILCVSAHLGGNLVYEHGIRVKAQ